MHYARITHMRRQYPIARVAAVAALLVWFVQRPSHRAVAPTPSAGCPEMVDVVRDPGGIQRMGDAPPRPQQGQQRATGNPPKCSPEYALALNGYCWLELKHSPPNCPKGSVPYDGRCLVALSAQARPPTSIQETP